MKHFFKTLAILIFVFTATISCNDDGDDNNPNPEPVITTFKATLNGASERPNPVFTTAYGNVTVTFNETTKMLTLTGTYTGMTATMAHIHGAATTEETAGPVITLTASGGKLSGSVTLTTAQEADLKAGLYYVNVHSDAYSAGEIRGQLLDENIMTFNATLNGSNERPDPVSTSAIGSVTVKFNNTTKMLSLSGTYTGMTATMAHIHGPATADETAGPVITLTASGGTLSGSVTLTTAQESDLKAGLYYINVHSSNYTGGEIRGQLLDGNTIIYNTTLNGDNERPTPVTTTATGMASVTFNNITKMLTLSGTYKDMTATAAHIHGPATTEQTADPVITLTASGEMLSGSVTLTTAQEADLKAGLYYINVHSSTYSGGEIRGQIGWD